MRLLAHLSSKNPACFYYNCCVWFKRTHFVFLFWLFLFLKPPGLLLFLCLPHFAHKNKHISYQDYFSFKQREMTIVPLEVIWSQRIPSKKVGAYSYCPGPSGPTSRLLPYFHYFCVFSYKERQETLSSNMTNSPCHLRAEERRDKQLFPC